jgi:hypothetical protein
VAADTDPWPMDIEYDRNFIKKFLKELERFTEPASSRIFLNKERQKLKYLSLKTYSYYGSNRIL